jgi:UDPglucose 6-dehydrogenase
VIYGDGPYADALRTHIGDDHPHAWIGQQVGVNIDGKPRTDEALDYIARICHRLDPGTLTIISTQLPVGSCRYLERAYPRLKFAVQPENVRSSTAVEDFEKQTRYVVGCRHDEYQRTFVGLFGARVLWMSPESAEMTKHALNGYLALMVRYGNELGRLCELWNADPLDVIAALRSEPRVSPAAPLLPGDPTSKHLLREVHTLIDLGAGPVVQALL